MKDTSSRQIDLETVAKQVMADNGFEPESPRQVQQQLAELKAHSPQAAPSATIRDLRALLWSSIDNDDSRDLDQVMSPIGCPMAKRGFWWELRT